MGKDSGRDSKGETNKKNIKLRDREGRWRREEGEVREKGRKMEREKEERGV